MKISELKPAEVFYYFSEISKIPHGSGNTRAIEEYCLSFAKEHGLEAYHDAVGNVMIFKPGTYGYEDSKPVILQGHLDMVCDKDPDCHIDMSKEAIKLVTDGEYLSAEGTTLGGDDGIAIAYTLAVLASDDLSHPPIEALFTIDEETGMDGALGLDASHLKGRMIINIDSEEEGVLTTSCAGGARLSVEVPLNRISEPKESLLFFEILIDGLQGGHSGIDINKGRENASVILGRVLEEVNSKYPLYICDVEGGERDNVIPKSSNAVIGVSASLMNEMKDIVEKAVASLVARGGLAEQKFSVTCTPFEFKGMVYDKESTELIIAALVHIPNGVIEMNPFIPDMVQTSSNLGIVKMKAGRMTLCALARSNAADGMEKLKRQFDSYVKDLGLEYKIDSEYPAWEYKEDSHLRDVMLAVYTEMFGKEPRVEGVHAGLEGGILASKLPGADIVSIGPDILDIHSARERLDIASVKRYWNYLKEVLRSLR